VFPLGENPQEERALTPRASRVDLSRKELRTSRDSGWRFVSIVVRLPERGCDVRQEPYIPGALSIL